PFLCSFTETVPSSSCVTSAWATTPASINSAKSSLILRSKAFRASGSYMVSRSLVRTIHFTTASASVLLNPIAHFSYSSQPIGPAFIRIRLLRLASRCRPLFSVNIIAERGDQPQRRGIGQWSDHLGCGGCRETCRTFVLRMQILLDRTMQNLGGHR